jgi:hypothetical protein
VGPFGCKLPRPPICAQPKRATRSKASASNQSLSYVDGGFHIEGMVFH